MSYSTDKHWQEWGATDPYFAVLARDKFRKENLESSIEEFFDSGVQQTSRLLELLERHFGTVGRGSALDFGCGVGRVAVAMAREFGSVVGLDISPAMLAEAKSNLRKFNLSNVALLPSDDNLSQVEGQFDLVHSCIVLQHIPVTRGRLIIRNLLDHIKPGGYAALHLSLRRNFPLVNELVYQARTRFLPASYAVNLLTGKRWNEPPVQINEYDLVATLDLFLTYGMKEIVVIPDPHGWCSTAWILGKKPQIEQSPAESTAPGP